VSFKYRGPLFPQEAPHSRANPLFHGRQRELYTLIEACQGYKTSYYVVYGGRQSGKTSLLLHLHHRLRQLAYEEEEDSKIFPCWADFQHFPGTSLQDVCLFLATQILKSVPGLGGCEVPRTFGQGGPLFDDWLCDIPLKGRRVVLLLEELATLPQETRQALGNILRAMFTSDTQRISLVLFGGIELLSMASQEVSSLLNVCEKIHLSDLSLDASRSVLAGGLGLDSDQSEGVEEFATMSAAIYGQVAGHPYLTQCLGERVLEYWQKAHRFPLEPAVGNLSCQLLKDDRHFNDLHNAIQQYGLLEDCQRLLNHPPHSGHDPAMVRLNLLGVAKRAGDEWTVRNHLLECALKTWLAEMGESELASQEAITKKNTMSTEGGVT